ncbi:MAG: MarR family winged helix-turn-helix transcriptional regulator [Dehalococcoidia bacterium]
MTPKLQERIPEEESMYLQTFTLLQRTRDLLFRCEDQAVAEFGITAEQYSVLMAMKGLDDPVKVTDVARRLERKVNSVSMLVDRMVNAGLVTRERDLPDRRAVRLGLTGKGQEASERAAPVVLKLVEELLSTLSHEDADILITLLQRLRENARKHLGTRN